MLGNPLPYWMEQWNSNGSQMQTVPLHSTQMWIININVRRIKGMKHRGRVARSSPLVLTPPHIVCTFPIQKNSAHSCSVANRNAALTNSMHAFPLLSLNFSHFVSHLGLHLEPSLKYHSISQSNIYSRRHLWILKASTRNECRNLERSRCRCETFKQYCGVIYQKNATSISLLYGAIILRFLTNYGIAQMFTLSKIIIYFTYLKYTIRYSMLHFDTIL